MFNLTLLKQGQDSIEQELIELENVMQENEINYSNLVHVVKKIPVIFGEHEKKEEELFKYLRSKGVNLGSKNFSFDSNKLLRIQESLKKAINSGNDYKVKEALRKEGEVLIREVRKRLQQEEWIFYGLVDS